MPFSCNVPTFVLCLTLLLSLPSFPTSAFALVPPRPSNCIPTSSSPAGSTDYDGKALTGIKQPTPTLTKIKNIRDTRWRLRAQNGQSQQNEQSGDKNALLDELLDEQEPAGKAAGQDVRGGGNELVSVSPFDSFLPRGDKLDSYIVKISLPAILNFAINPLIGAVDLFFGEN